MLETENLKSEVYDFKGSFTGIGLPLQGEACEGRGPRASPSANVGVAPSGRKQMRIYGALLHPAEAD